MSFANPLALLLLLSIPVIVLLHRYRSRRRDARVATLRFWDTATPQRAITHRVARKLRLDKLLALQLLAALLLSLAAAGPVVKSITAGWERAVLIVDTSASMQATDNPGGRFVAARDAALANLKPGQETMLIAAGAHPQVLVPFTKNAKEVRTALAALAPTDEPGRLEAALAIAYALADRGPPTEIHVFTDSAFPRPAQTATSPTSVIWHTSGHRNDNVAITVFEVRNRPGSAVDYEAYLSLANFSHAARDFSLQLRLDDRLVHREHVSLPAGVNRSLVVPLTHRSQGSLLAEIDPEDDLAVDDIAYAILADPRPLDVLLITRGNLFLEEALRADSRVRLQIATPESLTNLPNAPDIIVLDEIARDRLAPGRYLLIRSVASNAPLEHMGDVELPPVSDWAADHPIMRYVDLSNVAIQRAMRVHPVGPGVSLAEARETPLIHAWDDGLVRAVFIGFEPSESDLPVRAAFPLLVGNALRWLCSNRMTDSRASRHAGSPLELSLHTSAQQATVIDPHGLSRVVPITGGKLVYDETQAAGIYAVQTEDREYRYALNLLDEAESNLAPRENLAQEASAKLTKLPAYELEHRLWPVLAALALLAIAIEAWLYGRQATRPVSTLPLVLRAVVALLIGLTLLRPVLRLPSDRQHVTFVLDGSDSIPHEAWRRTVQRTAAALPAQSSHDTTRLVLLGGNTRLAELQEPDLTTMPIPMPLSISIADGKTSDLAEALHVALASSPRRETNRLVLMTDGNENRDSVLQAAREARRRGISVYPVPIGGPEPGEVLLQKMVLPEVVREGESFQVGIVAWSAQERDAMLHLYRDGHLVSSDSVPLRAGKNAFAYRESRGSKGIAAYEVRVDATGDANALNNRLSGAVVVHDQPKVLYVERDADQGRYLHDALQAQHFRVDQVEPGELARALGGLADYDALILSDVSALDISESEMEAVQHYVRDRGGGLIMLGGEHSFGLGGYYRTPIEEALPVTMESRRKLDVPTTAVVLVIDRSGSMNTEQGPFTRMDLAREAAQLAIELVSERSQVGIIVFDSEWSWAVPIAAASDKTAILAELASIEAGGGGTELFAALQEAYRVVSQSPAMARHLIILSDGEVPPAGFAQLLLRASSDRITVSTVAISSQAGVPLLRDISQWGGGRFYFTGDVYKIPRIFTMETQLASKAGLVEQSFRPVVRRRFHEILKGIRTGELPGLRGYVATTARPAAETLLVSHRNDPILSVWRYGIGRAAAFTSDLKTRWGVHWLQWRDFSMLLSQLVRWTLRHPDRDEIATRIRVSGGRGELRIDATGDDGEFKNFLAGELGVVSPDGRRSVAPVLQTGPGHYRVGFSANAEGVYRLGLVLRDGERQIATRLRSVSVAYSREHGELSVNHSLLEALARATGGQVLDDPAVVFSLDRSSAWRSVQAWPWLLAIALALLVGDLAIRWRRGKRDNR
ncbi:MAG: VWA domain-containing protein [Gammaproteobacteria bacterium]